jgi:hypothetical protein
LASGKGNGFILLYLCRVNPQNLKIRLYILLLLLPVYLKAQDVQGVEESIIIYRKVMQGGLSIHSRGLGIHYRRGHKIHANKTFLYDFAWINIRHPKEVKTVNAFSNNNSGFLYGKLNSLYSVHTGVGIQKIIHPKGDLGTTAIGYSYYGGISWGMAKPVYLYIFYASDMEGVQERLERYDPDKHFPDNIAGRASILKGINESRFFPGVYGTFQLNFEFSKQENKIRMLETGISADLFPYRIRLMADEKPGQFFFLNFFIRFIFGKQWNHP